LNQQLDNGCVSLTGRQVDRCDASVIHGIDVCPFFDEQWHDFNVVHCYGPVKQGRTVAVPGIGRRTVHDQSAYIAEISTLDSVADIGTQIGTGRMLVQ